jgi:putative sterol carrier protein
MTKAAEVFEELGNVGRIAAMRNVSASYVYHIRGAGDWRVTVRDGAVGIQKDGGSAEADASFTCDEQEFVDMVQGSRKMITTAMQGRLSFKGDYEHLMAQLPLFQSIQREHQRRQPNRERVQK